MHHTPSPEPAVNTPVSDSVRAILNLAAANPHGHRALPPYSAAVAVALHHGYLTTDSTNTGIHHLTRTGWLAMGSAGQTWVWSQAVREHCIRQGPVTAYGLRALCREYAALMAAAARVHPTHPNVAMALVDEGGLVLRRLALLVHAPLIDPPATVVVRLAENEADTLFSHELARGCPVELWPDAVSLRPNPVDLPEPTARQVTEALLVS